MDDSKKVITYFKLDKHYIEELKSIFGISSQSDYKYEYIDKRSVEITRYTGKGGDVVIPDTIGDNLKVVRIGKSAFAGCVGLTSVTLPDTVTEIGEMAFSNCTNMAAITIASSVARIESFAFAGCVKIVMIILPKSLTYLGDEPFVGCTNLRIIDVDPDNKAFGSINGILFSKNMDTLLLCPQGYMGEYYIPDCVVSVNRSAFIRCKSVTGITIPDSVVRIGSYAFAECVNLKRVTIPDSVTDIGENVFINCTGLTELSVPKSISGKLDVGRDILFVRENKQDDKISTTVPEPTIVVENNNSAEKALPKYSDIQEAPQMEFEYKEKEDGTAEITAYKGKKEIAVIPSIIADLSVSEIGNLAFSGQESLKKVHIPENVKRIGDGAFLNCISLEEVNIPSSVTEIGDFSFSRCVSLKEVKIPGSVLTIGSEAFSGCKKLENVTISEGVKKIGARAFFDSKVNRISIPKSVTEIGESAFVRLPVGYKTTIVGIKGSYAEKYVRTAKESRLLDFAESEHNEYEFPKTSDIEETPGEEFSYIVKEDGTVEITEYKGKRETVVFPCKIANKRVSSVNMKYGSSMSKIAKNVYLPGSITEIADNAFRFCDRIEKVVIPSSVRKIGDSAFSSCSKLKEVVIPEGITEIGRSAFYDCRSLVRVKIPGSVRTIGHSAFYECKKLETVIISEGLEIIEDYAFSDTKISRIFIPQSVTFIGNMVFHKGLFGGKTKIVGVKGSYAEKYTLREPGLSFEKFK